MATEVQPGTFPQAVTSAGPFALTEMVAAGSPIRTPGVVRVAPLLITPNLTERWTLLGWSVRLRVGGLALSSTATVPSYARFGKLFAGVMLDASLQNAGGSFGGLQAPGSASFPIDFSTFTTLWEQDDYIPIFPSVSQIGTEDQFALIGMTFMIPSPVQIRSGSQVQMAMILTPSILPAGAGLLVKRADFSLIYDNGRN